MHTVTINRRAFEMAEGECQPIPHAVYTNLQLYTDIVDLERVVGLVRDLSSTLQLGICTHGCVDVFGGYLSEELAAVIQRSGNVYVDYGTRTIRLIHEDIHQEEIRLPWVNHAPWSVSVSKALWAPFRAAFHWYLRADETQWEYDNLLQLVMIVKNAGDEFAAILERNIPYIDGWTILDTGSTDDTVATIQRVLGSRVRGNLYQEPFVDFSTSRNRALELAGEHCKFTLMLDDTYYVSGDLRGFLNEIRSDQFADSYSLFIRSADVEYASNRLLKSDRQLRYRYKIHEVVQKEDNVVIIVPSERAVLHDATSAYMAERTRLRKPQDIRLLRESIQEDPDNPRHVYYLAQTYMGMEEYESAYRYFVARAYHPEEGFLQEKIDAVFEAARVAQFKLERPWSEVKPLYELAHALDPTRPDSVYFLGIQAWLTKNLDEAYRHFKKAFQIGYPQHAQYSLKPTLSYHYTPRFLCDLCYDREDYSTGEAAANLYAQHNPPNPYVDSWRQIYRQLNKRAAVRPVQEVIIPAKPVFCIVADGNWTPWTGRDIYRRGLGGSETYVVEMARWIQLHGCWDVFVFCRCSVEEEFEGVHYFDLEKYYGFIEQHAIFAVLISRFSEYIPLTLKSRVQNVYLVVHDLSVTGLHVHLDPKLRQVFTLTAWHKEHFDQIFPALQSLTTPLHYGIEFPAEVRVPRLQRAHRFIYSSFANRGLDILLQMWPRIRACIPDARLDVYADLKHAWTLQHYPEMMKRIETLVRQPGVHCHGWVDKPTLYEAWSRADIWLYPCIFKETFCLTALEAAASETLVIASDLAALRDTVGDRGLLIPGDPHTPEWQDEAIQCVERIVQNPSFFNSYLHRNKEWADAHSWKNQAARLVQAIETSRLPRVVHLVLHSDHPYYRHMYQTSRAYYASWTCRGVDTIYYAYRENQTEAYVYDRDAQMLWIRGSEQHTPCAVEYNPGLMRKLINALTWVQAQFPEYDYMVRSSVSTLVQWQVLLPLLRSVPAYGGVTMTYRAADRATEFARGIGIVLTREMVDHVLREAPRVEESWAEDVALARFIQAHYPPAYPPVSLNAHFQSVRDYGLDRDALRRDLTPAIRQATAFFRFKAQEFDGVFDRNLDDCRLTDAVQLKWTLESLSAPF
jgi:glycosyltransferase involved in cell wall biosynthesis